jgi:hypothetical protein
LSPQIVGATVVAPLTVKVSIQVPVVGWAVAKVIKSNLKENEIKRNIHTKLFFVTIKSQMRKQLTEFSKLVSSIVPQL